MNDIAGDAELEQKLYVNAGDKGASESEEEEGAMLSSGGEEDMEDLLAAEEESEGRIPSEIPATTATSTDGVGKEKGLDEKKDEETSDWAPLNPSTTTLPATTTPSATTTTTPTASDTTTTSATFRNRHHPDPSLSPSTITPAAAAEPTPTSTTGSAQNDNNTEKNLSDHRQEQDSLTASLVTMAAQLKASSQNFHTSLESEKSVLDRAVDGLDRTTMSMASAERRMGMLRRMTEGKGWWGRMLLYATIFALWIVALVIVFVLPKLR